MTDWDKLIHPNTILAGPININIEVLARDAILDTKNLVETYIEIRNRSNKVPTHDPYTNPDSHIYYECKCGAILDPGTKSFAALNGVASNKGWKIRFGETGYTPYCVKCGEGVE